MCVFCNTLQSRAVLVILDSAISFPVYGSRYVVEAMNLKRLCRWYCSYASGFLPILGGVMMPEIPRTWIFQVSVSAGRTVNCHTLNCESSQIMSLDQWQQSGFCWTQAWWRQYRDSATDLSNPNSIPDTGKSFTGFRNVYMISTADISPFCIGTGGCYRAAGALSWQFSYICCQGKEWVELFYCCPYTPS
jgi:hypothetical protein